MSKIVKGPGGINMAKVKRTPPPIDPSRRIKDAIDIEDNLETVPGVHRTPATPPPPPRVRNDVNDT